MSPISPRAWMVLHPQMDNVAIALKALEPDEDIDGVAIQEPIRQYHKIALTDIGLDQPVYKYGQVIGYATQPIAAGTWVHTHNLGMGRLMDTTITDLVL